MIDCIYLAFFALYFVATAGAVIPVWVSVAITAIHTVEESRGRLWDQLGLPATVYFAFQALVLLLGITAAESGGIASVAFIAIRLGDVIVTHCVLKKVGMLTAVFLLCDAGWHALLLI